MTTTLKALLLVFTSTITAVGCTAVTKPGPSSVPLRVASWNIEHLAYPSASGCRPRDEAELAALRQYAENLSADVIALQEVDSVAALEQIFSPTKWRLVLSDRKNSRTYECRGSNYTSTQQKTAFAIKKEITLSNVESFQALGVGVEGLRHGLEVTLNTSVGEVSILNVHLKSGCFVSNYQDSNKPACQLLARQLPVLKSWLSAHADEQYIVLGDFNHRLSQHDNHFWHQLISGQTIEQASVINATKPLKGCHPRYPVPIDHILVSKALANDSVIEPKVHFFADMEEGKMLSDHCAISVSMRAQ
ncbi:endonuclease/exonuclease/phosphatase family protein [Pseudoalteromonas piscicida]|uniref:endonuclease/exonuclease/phosphatase family protein n=1 Tax=Pseudoalteromonas piscicida TaxID=43662 RepID=UPI0030964C65